jgi:NitT/TauT family transport system substrate-binding protein
MACDYSPAPAAVSVFLVTDGFQQILPTYSFLTVLFSRKEILSLARSPHECHSEHQRRISHFLSITKSRSFAYQLRMTSRPSLRNQQVRSGVEFPQGKTRRIINSIIFSLAISIGSSSAARAEKIRTAIPQANLNYLSIYVADAKGFFKDEGLDNETVVISGPLSIAALLSGDVDYSGAGGSGMRAALKGAPIKGIMFQADKVTFYLVVDPTIKSARDLKGKKIAIGSPGDTQDRIMTMFAERAGVAAREIIRISMGADTNTRVMAVKTGAANATTVDPGGLIFAQKEGLTSLGFLGDLFPMPFQGFVTIENKLRDNPGQIKRWLKGVLRGLMFVRDRPEEAVDIGSKKLQLGNATRSMMIEGVKNYIRALSPGVPGLPTQEGIKNFLEYDIRIPLQLKENVPPERLLSLQLVAEVVRELEASQRRTTR